MNMIQKRQQMRGQSGFTLIELLVAIAILGVLAGVAVFAVGGLQTNAKKAACETERDTYKTALAAAKIATNPQISPGLYISGQESIAASANVVGTYWTITTNALGGTGTLAYSNATAGICAP
jgi:prepilin-type N-terminal cleavage/methylation domain-containing protein